MKNAQVGERVRLHLAYLFIDGIVDEIHSERVVKIKWDDPNEKDYLHHESKLIRLVPKKRVSREALANFWKTCICEKHHEHYAYMWNNFDKLCDLVGVK